MKHVSEGPGVQAALDLFEAKWEELIGLPSRQSAADDPEVRILEQSIADWGSRMLVHGIVCAATCP